MNILVACEFSGRVRDAFRAKGHKALSCDLEPSEKPGPHYQGDVRDILDEGWDMLIAFPPCTYLSAACSWRWKETLPEIQEAVQFVQLLWDAPIRHIALENPVGYLNRHWNRPSQVIHPYYFGEAWSKRTCLWLKHVPPLMISCLELNPKKYVHSLGGHNKRERQKRSLTFPGIAEAMAEQWGDLDTREKVKLPGVPKEKRK